MAISSISNVSTLIWKRISQDKRFEELFKNDPRNAVTAVAGNIILSEDEYEAVIKETQSRMLGDTKAPGKKIPAPKVGKETAEELQALLEKKKYSSLKKV